jgi:hypothetical protein
VSGRDPKQQLVGEIDRWTMLRRLTGEFFSSSGLSVPLLLGFSWVAGNRLAMAGASKLCEFCSQVAKFFCEADQAYLCASYDEQIHGDYVVAHRIHHKRIQGGGALVSGSKPTQATAGVGGWSADTRGLGIMSASLSPMKVSDSACVARDVSPRLVDGGIPGPKAA